MNDHNIFNQVVYTPLSEALRTLEEPAATDTSTTKDLGGSTKNPE